MGFDENHESSQSGDWGSASWEGNDDKTLEVIVNEGCTVDLCVKAGPEATSESGIEHEDSGVRTYHHGISHIGVRVTRQPDDESIREVTEELTESSGDGSSDDATEEATEEATDEQTAPGDGANDEATEETTEEATEEQTAPGDGPNDEATEEATEEQTAARSGAAERESRSRSDYCMRGNRGWTLVRDVDATTTSQVDELAATGGFEVNVHNPCPPVEKTRAAAPVRLPKTGAGYALLAAIGLGRSAQVAACCTGCGGGNGRLLRKPWSSGGASRKTQAGGAACRSTNGSESKPMSGADR